MRIARIIGTVTLNQTEPSVRPGRFLIAETLDGQAATALPKVSERKTPMSESMVIYDELGAGVGQLVAVSEGREASMPFWPQRVSIDAYCAAILDSAVVKE